MSPKRILSILPITREGTEKYDEINHARKAGNSGWSYFV